MFLTDTDWHDALPNINPSTLFPIFEASPPSGEVIALCGGKVFLGRGTQGRLVNLGVTAIDL